MAGHALLWLSLLLLLYRHGRLGRPRLRPGVHRAGVGSWVGGGLGGSLPLQQILQGLAPLKSGAWHFAPQRRAGLRAFGARRAREPRVGAPRPSVLTRRRRAAVGAWRGRIPPSPHPGGASLPARRRRGVVRRVDVHLQRRRPGVPRGRRRFDLRAGRFRDGLQNARAPHRNLRNIVAPPAALPRLARRIGAARRNRRNRGGAMTPPRVTNPNVLEGSTASLKI
mmetsp:Transcript_28860/g.99465  ORF Transcript_28860/g.99465 Transcript_28860/m.99465 type:complete len:224 (+) Transcript_28860:959-1630(+)